MIYTRKQRKIAENMSCLQVPQDKPETLRKVWDNLKLRLNYLNKVHGGHVEPLMD